MKGFFDKEKIDKKLEKTSQKINISKNKKQKTDLINPCDKCGLYKNCNTPKMQPTGQGKKKILIVAEAPGKTEDEKGIQLTGASGQLLRDSLEEIGTDLDRDCWKTNAIICRPPGNKTPTNTQINYCKPNLIHTIEELKPEKILCLGKISLQAVIGHKQSITSFGKWLKWIIPDQEYSCFISANYHPAYLLRNQEDIILNREFQNDLKSFFEYDKKFIPISTPYTIYKDEKVLELLEKITDRETIIFDYETTGLKPYDEGHKIICVSISTCNPCYANGTRFSFAFNLENRKIKKKWIEILENENIHKIAHNIAFENIWSKVILNVDIKGWIWDTMLATHIMDNRASITGLKFQTYVNFGVAGYDDNVKKFITPDDTGFNRLLEMEPDELYTYCVQDSIYTNYLYQKQVAELKEKEALHFFVQGALELSIAQTKGWTIDIPHFEKTIRRLGKKIDIIQEKIEKTEEYKIWKKEKSKPLNVNSSTQLRELFFDILNLESIKQTTTGNDSVDESVLEELNNPLANLISESRKLKKIKTTYMEGFLSETNQDSKIHPSYNLNNVTTYRSSSSNPNLQNVPKRDKTALKMIRSGIKPSRGRQLLEVDYSGLEVRISACYHKDPVMIKYLQGHGDMHRDTASEIFLIDPDDITKEQRYTAKNKFVFPQFYGSWYMECAKNIWKTIDEKTLKHLKKQGIKNQSLFEDHVQSVEDNFWNKRFKVYNKWKKDTWNQYLKDGFIKSKTGFTYNGIMKRNDVLNYPIQGAAFHCLLWSFITLNQWMREKQMDSYIIGQIHDSIILDVVSAELSVLAPKIKKVTCEELRNYWKWIIIPLDVEAEISEIDGNWFNMKEFKL